MRSKLITLSMAGLAVAAVYPATAKKQEANANAAVAPVQEVPRPCIATQKKFASYVRKVYKRDKVSKKALYRLVKLRKCAKSPKAARNMRKLQKHESRKRRARISARVASDRCTPYGRWAIPAYIVMRESGGANVPNRSGSSASGYYQILSSTWRSAILRLGARAQIRNAGYEAMAAPKHEQDCVAYRLWRDSPQHWAATL